MIFTLRQKHLPSDRLFNLIYKHIFEYPVQLSIAIVSNLLQFCYTKLVSFVKAVFTDKRSPPTHRGLQPLVNTDSPNNLHCIT